MKNLKKLFVFLAIIVIVSSSFLVFADPVSPTIIPNYDITGIWKNQWNDNFQVFQDGLDVYFTYVNTNFSHYFHGRYLAPDVIEGTIVRKSRNEGTITSLLLIWQIQSNDQIHHTLRLLNSNYHNDIPIDYSEDVTYTRVN